MQCNLHSVPLVFLAIDAYCNCYAFHIRHIVFLIAFTVIYLVINMVYSLMVTPIYAPLKWVDISSYVLAVGCILAVLLVHFLARLLFRRWKVHKLPKKEREEENGLNPLLRRETG